MKKILAFLIIALIFVQNISCKNNKNAIKSGVEAISNPESLAKLTTDQMVKALGLDGAQTEKVMMLNLVNYKVLQKLKPSESDKIASVKDKYIAEMKAVLSSPQFEKFLKEFVKF